MSNWTSIANAMRRNEPEPEESEWERVFGKRKPLGELAITSPHSPMDNRPLGLGNENPAPQDATKVKKLKLKSLFVRFFLFDAATNANAPTSPMPDSMQSDTSLIWHHLNKKPVGND